MIVETILAALVASAFGSAAYLYQKSVDRKEALIEKRRTAYEAMLSALYHFDFRERARGTEQYDKARLQLALLASDDVLRALSMVHEGTHVDGDGIGPEDLNQRSVDLVCAMREDVFESTKISGSDLEYILPIGIRSVGTTI
ncbi:hypothetical protein PVW51_00500 [Sulfitobacter sp. PR48]|uniref:hypothetical protein n=1 Tax=Sulfitobacter sp. PR48 TaxID=3028383 RepID=UPI00237C2F5E|nr:hypothetical protein [Sulfitobacter sp. PR48]MDD9719149.1 hypothetical protein [Sulfitobacter sp. PR48]